jgi:hypothetical protein
MDLNAVSRQDVCKSLGHRQPKACGEKIPKDHTFILRGFGVVSFPGNRQIPGSKQPSNRSASKSALVIKDRPV